MSNYEIDSGRESCHVYCKTLIISTLFFVHKMNIYQKIVY
jgi:hypothetical protein